MGDKTKIQWCDASWPVINGCRRCSPGCENCYAERLIATRLSQMPKYKGLAVFKESGPRWTGESRLWRKHLDWPLRWNRPRKIFVADMGDLFYDGVTNEEIAAVFGVMAACPQHTFQVLTKRADRMRAWFRWIAAKVKDNNSFLYCAADDLLPASTGEPWPTKLNAAELHGRAWSKHAKNGCRWAWPLPNVWLGVSVEDQQRADERIPLLLDTPAAVRWVSAEPLLAPLGLARHFPHVHGMRNDRFWLVVGGESGPGARPFDIQWANSLVKQCQEANVPCFVKQFGANAHDSHRSLVGGWSPGDPEPDTSLHLASRKGDDMKEWPAELRVRQFPEVQP